MNICEVTLSELLRQNCRKNYSEYIYKSSRQNISKDIKNPYNKINKRNGLYIIWTWMYVYPFSKNCFCLIPFIPFSFYFVNIL